MTVMGIEDAGRGPIIGPMVMAGVVVNKNDEKTLKEMGVKDSKLLKPEVREELFDQIIKLAISHKIVIVSAKEIDEAIDGPESMNLNWLEASVSADIINALDAKEVIIDCPSPNLEAYNGYIKAKTNKEIKIITEHKADLNHPVVSAASILAKVTRDREVKKIHKAVNQDFGSGYLTDPKTQTFMEKHWKSQKHIFRHSWSTYKKLESEASQARLGDF